MGLGAGDVGGHAELRVPHPEPQAPDVGLCFSCAWARRITNRRGSVFFRCSRAESDTRFVRYPPLPVKECVGYEEGETTKGGRAVGR